MAERTATASLLGLPSELREKMYTLVFPVKQGITLHEDDKPASWEPAL